MSLKTRRRKIGGQPSAKRVDRRRRAQAKFLQFCASQWFDRKSLLDQLRKCDKPISGRDVLRMQVDYTRGANDPGEPERYAEAKARIQEMAKGVLERMRKHYDRASADAALKRVEDFRAMYPGN